VYGHEVENRPTRLFADIATTVSAALPLAYAIPPEWKSVVEILKLHGVRVERIEHPQTRAAEVYRFRNVTWAEQPFEGHHLVRFVAEKATETRTIPAGWFLIPMNQRTGRLILSLLEPEAPDSFVHWGLFDRIFEQKEDYSDYVMEQVARQMLEKDPRLKEEFAARLTSDPPFAGNRRARLDFFYVRSPYFEKDKNVYPVLRIVGR
jgi:hypothetical protein